METKFDDIEWRTPDGTERRAMLACSAMYYKDKLHGTLLGATLFLPAVGAWIGVLWALSAMLVSWIGLPALIGAAILTAFPFLVTGGMHMDGFLDVTDAVKSWREQEERRRILKDPNVGSFAVIAGILLVMLQFALFASAKEDADVFTLILIPVMKMCSPETAAAIADGLNYSYLAGPLYDGNMLMAIFG